MTSMNSSGVLSSLNSTSALKISEGGVREMQTMPWLDIKSMRMAKEQKGHTFVCFHLLSLAEQKDTVLVKNELNEFLWAVGERNRGVVGEAATFLGLRFQKKQKKHVQSFEKKRKTDSQEWKSTQTCQSKQVLTNKYFCNWLVSLFRSDAFRQEKRNRSELFALHKNAN